MQQFWDERYSANNHVYGEGPNVFFKNFIDGLAPGNLLLPAEGEGRNAIYAASKGWVVEAFDFSPVAREKALGFAAASGVQLRYDLLDITRYKAEKQYDLVALLYVHLPEAIREAFFTEIYKSIRPGGYLLLEGFAKEQMQFSSGGPKDPAQLYDTDMLRHDFRFLHSLDCRQEEVSLDEGDFHKGKSALVRRTGQRF